MPRVERPLDSDGSLLAQFAATLRALRADAGSPPYRELARRAHYSSTTLSDAAGGRRLPSLDVTLAYVRACGGNVEEWEQRWRSAAAALAVPSTAGQGDRPAPYVGLRAYDVEDARWFFGRERTIDDLLHRLAAQRVVAVVGKSGSGTSSILHAGLVPRLTGPVLLVTPGAHPLDACATQLASLTGCATEIVRRDLECDANGLHRQVGRLLDSAAADGTAGLVVIVDQLDELFTVCRNESERRQFLAVLFTAARGEGGHCRVVFGARADLQTRSAPYPDLADALGNAPITVGPMTPAELRRAISQPAVQAHCTVENDLVVTLVALVHDQAGALAWLSHALREIWRRRKGNALTLAAFEMTGRLGAALASAAEAAFTALDEHQQDIARELFLRLDARSEFAAVRAPGRDSGDAPAVTEVINHFARARVLVRAADGVELAHPALLAVWPRLASWLSDRESRHIRHHLAHETAFRERLHRDPSALLRGNRLAIVQAWAHRAGSPSAGEQTFLAAGAAAEQQRHRAAARGSRRNQQLVAALAALLGMAAGVTAQARLLVPETATCRTVDDPRMITKGQVGFAR